MALERKSDKLEASSDEHSSNKPNGIQSAPYATEEGADLRYQPPKRTQWERFLDRFKPRSAAGRTTLLVCLISFFSLAMSLWFFWRTLYLPEIHQHARYLSSDIKLLQSAQQSDIVLNSTIAGLDTELWLREQLGIELVDNPKHFPNVKDKLIAEIFTDRLRDHLARQLHLDPEQITVYFQFKPSPTLWVKTPFFQNTWLREPLPTYANYSLELIIGWFMGIPILTFIIILTLVRQLNRPLKRLQNAANQYAKFGRAPYLTTTHGPLEIRQVNASFNHMISNIQQIEQDRRVMLAGISHDLRSPLTRIRLTAEMLPDEYLKEGLIYDVDDMDAILNQFISYMRDGSDEPLHLTQINELIDELIVQFQPLNIEFNAGDIVPIQARTMSLKRLIANLINNAKRYGAMPIIITTEQYPKHIILTVRDCGEGIPPEQIQSLMQPFVRGNSARTLQGSGLGLAIVKRIVDLHQGQIEIANHAEGGLEIKIQLPIDSEGSN